MSWQLVVLVKPLQDELPDHEVLTGSNNARLPKSRTSLQTDICLLGAPVFPPPCPAVTRGRRELILARHMKLEPFTALSSMIQALDHFLHRDPSR